MSLRNSRTFFIPPFVKICLVTNNNLVDRVEKRHKDEIVSGKQIKFGKDTQSGDKTIQ